MYGYAAPAQPACHQWPAFEYSRGGDGSLPAMSDILTWGNRHPTSEWATEAKSQFTWASGQAAPPAPAPMQTMVPVPMQTMAPPQFQSMQVPMQTVMMPVMAPVPAAAATSEPASEPAPEPEPEPAPAPAPPTAEEAPVKRPLSAAQQRAASARAARAKRPPFHAYGRANTRPTVGGFMFGDYLATHNAVAGSTLPRTRRAVATDRLDTANTHHMEADLRATTRDMAATPSAPPAEAEAEAEVAAPAAAAAVPEPIPAPAPSAPAPQPAANTSAAAYGSVPYDPATFCCPPPTAPAAAGCFVPMPGYTMMAAPAPAPQPFAPHELGASLDPRKYKYAPHHVIASLPAAGRRSVRADNLRVVGPVDA